MTAPTLTITISRSPTDLVLSGTVDSNELGIVGYRPPALIPRYGYAPDSRFIDGSELTSVAWQQAILAFDWVPDQAANESDVTAAYADVVAAIGQFEFTVTTKVSDATAEVWAAVRGSISLASQGRAYADLAHKNPVYTVTIPVQPIPGAPTP